jgi:hypothetical protein
VGGRYDIDAYWICAEEPCAALSVDVREHDQVELSSRGPRDL